MHRLSSKARSTRLGIRFAGLCCAGAGSFIFWYVFRIMMEPLLSSTRWEAQLRFILADLFPLAVLLLISLSGVVQGLRSFLIPSLKSTRNLSAFVTSVLWVVAVSASELLHREFPGWQLRYWVWLVGLLSYIPACMIHLVLTRWALLRAEFPAALAAGDAAPTSTSMVAGGAFLIWMVLNAWMLEIAPHRPTQWDISPDVWFWGTLFAPFLIALLLYAMGRHWLIHPEPSLEQESSANPFGAPEADPS